MRSQVYLVIQELEIGYENGDVYQILSAHRTSDGATDAVNAWRAKHTFSGDWCECHGLNVSVDGPHEVRK